MTERVLCEICPKACHIQEGHKGFCGARVNRQGQIVADNYGKVTSLALDPIEKKPLKRFYPDSLILSVGSFGCNLRCPFCQNYAISMEWQNEDFLEMSPEQLVEKAIELLPRGNIGLAYTYNEPLVGWEFVFDCAKLAARRGLKNVVVTNGYVNARPFEALLPYIDAFNIDLKGFSDAFYEKIGGDLEVVKNTIAMAAQTSHVEVTTLVIPGENDSAEEMRQLSSWLATVDPEIPLHITRFFPRYKMAEQMPTPVTTILALAKVARESLRYVYEGNL